MVDHYNVFIQNMKTMFLPLLVVLEPVFTGTLKGEARTARALFPNSFIFMLHFAHLPPIILCYFVLIMRWSLSFFLYDKKAFLAASCGFQAAAFNAAMTEAEAATSADADDVPTSPGFELKYVTRVSKKSCPIC